MRKVNIHKIRQIGYHIIGFGLAIILPLSAAINAPDLRFKHLTIQEGLSNNRIYSIVQDQDSFIWIGTEDGLNRFDGYDLVQYRQILNDSTSLPGDVIMQLFIDRDHNLWVATYQGVARYNREMDSFIRYPYYSSDNLPQTIYSRVIHENRAGDLLFGTSNGVYKLNQLKTSLESYTLDLLNTNWNATNVRALFEDSDSVLWIGSSTDGLISVNKDKNKVIRYHTNSLDENHAPSSYIFSIFEDSWGKLWIGAQNGLFQLDRLSGRFRKYQYNPADQTSYGNIGPYCIFEDKHQNLWFGSDGGGLSLYLREQDGFLHYMHSIYNPESINNNYVRSMFLDQQDILWVGTMQNGVNFAELNRLKPFNTMRLEPGNPNSLNYNVISSIYECPHGLLYIGTDGGGLNLYDKNNNQFTHFLHDAQNKQSIGSNSVLTIFEDSEQNVWMGGYDGGLSLFSEANETFITYKHNNSNPKSISNNDVRCIIEDSKLNLWIATNGGGLNLFDRLSLEFNQLRVNANDPGNSLCSDWVLTLMEDIQQNLWIGTYGGLSHYNLETQQFTNFYQDDDDSTSLSDNWIYCLLEDQRGNIWIGTSNGLSRYNATINNFRSFYKENGLPSNTINGMLEDDNGNLWLSTNKGICRFNTYTFETRNYDRVDGLQGDQFMHGAHFRSTSGEMHFGGMYGLTHFQPQNISENPFVPSIHFTGFQVFYKSVTGQESETPILNHINSVNEITLSHKHTAIMLNYVAINFISSEMNQYAYQLEGFDTDWHYVGTRREVTYTNLDPGKYVFKVKGSNNDGIWNEEGSSIYIIITSPFWQTWLFRIVLIICIIGATLIIFKLRIRTIENNRRKLAREVEERTTELIRSNDELAQFTYVAFHDLQEPIRIISSYSTLLERTLGNKLDDNSKEFLEFMRSSALHMQKLIEGLLQFTQVTTKAKPIIQTESSRIIQKALSRLDPVIEEIGAEITRDPLPTIQADPAQIETVFVNLILNGLKYIKPDQSPKIHISVAVNYKEWIFSVKDNGIGIEQEFKEKIFGIFKRLHTRDEYTGIGIGLPVSKKIVERHGGCMWIESELGKGSTFYFTIPIEPVNGNNFTV
ncbi:hypothetical protein HQ585_17310 [candidate division KSB1 bacterium]|nr:hypothetical protein [candidate division KSB1 bacterium]